MFTAVPCCQPAGRPDQAHCGLARCRRTPMRGGSACTRTGWGPARLLTPLDPTPVDRMPMARQSRDTMGEPDIPPSMIAPPIHRHSSHQVTEHSSQWPASDSTNVAPGPGVLSACCSGAYRRTASRPPSIVCRRRPPWHHCRANRAPQCRRRIDEHALRQNCWLGLAERANRVCALIPRVRWWQPPEAVRRRNDDAVALFGLDDEVSPAMPGNLVTRSAAPRRF
jgi:hypothetical protein